MVNTDIQWKVMKLLREADDNKTTASPGRKTHPSNYRKTEKDKILSLVAKKYPEKLEQVKKLLSMNNDDIEEPSINNDPEDATRETEVIQDPNNTQTKKTDELTYRDKKNQDHQNKLNDFIKNSKSEETPKNYTAYDYLKYFETQYGSSFKGSPNFNPVMRIIKDKIKPMLQFASSIKGKTIDSLDVFKYLESICPGESSIDNANWLYPALQKIIKDKNIEITNIYQPDSEGGLTNVQEYVFNKRQEKEKNQSTFDKLKKSTTKTLGAAKDIASKTIDASKVAAAGLKKTVSDVRDSFKEEYNSINKGAYIMREQDDLTKGKSDWMNYQQKKNQVKEDRKLDQEHNENIAKRKLKKQPNPDGGIQLG